MCRARFVAATREPEDAAAFKSAGGGCRHNILLTLTLDRARRPSPARLRLAVTGGMADTADPTLPLARRYLSESFIDAVRARNIAACGGVERWRDVGGCWAMPFGPENHRGLQWPHGAEGLALGTAVDAYVKAAAGGGA